MCIRDRSYYLRSAAAAKEASPPEQPEEAPSALCVDVLDKAEWVRRDAPLQSALASQSEKEGGRLRRAIFIKQRE